MSGHGDRGWGPRSGGRSAAQALVFIALGALGEALAALPPGPAQPGYYWASVAVFVLTALTVLLPWPRVPRPVVFVPIVGYLVSVALLLVSGGSADSLPTTAAGLGALVLIPVLASALYYPPSYTVITVGASVVTLAVAGIVAGTGGGVNLRRVLLWAGVSVVVATTIHRLRASLEGEVQDSAELARLGRLMNGASQSLTSRRDPKEVIVEGTTVMSELTGSGVSRASYMRVRDGVVTEEAVADELGSGPFSHLLRDDPYVREVVGTGQTLVTRLDRQAMGPTLRSLVEETGITDAAYVPISPNGEPHGIMAIDSRGHPLSEDVVSRCRALGNVVELALANALAHHELEIQANSDPLTGLANRRGLALYLEGDRGLGPLSILVLDIDGLKAVNDLRGHDVGDEVLVAVARAASASLREGDLLARTGGDEFMAVVADADESDARRVADRMIEAVSRITLRGVRVSVSVGYACCGSNGDLDRVRQQADEAMYEAKRIARRRHRRHSRATTDPSGVPAASPEQAGP